MMIFDDFWRYPHLKLGRLTFFVGFFPLEESSLWFPYLHVAIWGLKSDRQVEGTAIMGSVSVRTQGLR